MDYKKEIKMLGRGRERYFPVIDALLDAGTSPDGRPLPIDDPGMMRTVLELIDIGYLDPDAFIIDKRFGEVRGLSCRGGALLTESGWAQYKMHHGQQRKRNFRRLVILSALFASTIAIFLAYILSD